MTHDRTTQDPEAAAASELHRLLNGYQLAQAIHVSAVLGVADHLVSGPRSSDDLAAAVGAHPSALYRLLRALAGFGVFHETPPRQFELTPVGQCLRSDASQPVRPYAVFTAEPSQWRAWGALLHSVKTGENAFRAVHGTDVWQYRAEHPEQNAIFNAAMTGNSRRVDSAVVEACALEGTPTVVDVGGGEGSLLSALLRTYPGARGVLFDQPHVLAASTRVLEQAGVGSRCRVVGGDMFDAVPAGADVYVMKYIVHDWQDAEALRVLASCRRAMGSTAVLWIVDRLVGAPNEDPAVKLADLHMLVSPGGVERTPDEMRALIEAAGLRLVEVRATRSPVSVLVCAPAREAARADSGRGAASARPMAGRHVGTARASALVMRAEQRPMPGIDRPGPHQRYRAPVLRIEERVLGEVPRDHVRVRVRLAGVCGTDLNTVTTDPRTGYILGSAPLDLDEDGRVLGHEGIGEILDVGRDVTNVRAGEWAGFESILSCRRCKPCLAGRPNQCATAVLMGTQRDGLFTEVADVPARLAHRLGSVADTEDGRRAAACLEPAACSLLALRLARVRPGDDVLIFGAGPIGAAAAMLARVIVGAGRVRVVEPLPLRRELARRWADDTFEVEQFFASSVGEPADVLIETSGDLDNVRRALPITAPNARVALLARSGAPLAIDHVDHMITNNVTLFGCRGHLGGPVPEVLDLVRGGRLPLHELVTGVLPSLDALADELRAPRELMAKHCKVLVSP